ncbi:hypothetical protein [Thioclava sp. SK-1]|uniref:hypothetical protein n=1 Tax=Thioclava sp. SK-1 TaxID=1889770 RepID=UPI00114CD5D7|nr:hypothetical protein [Thioclava sp. SK-1]
MTIYGATGSVLSDNQQGETINRIIRAGRHRFGRCIYLILKAVEAALHDKASKLTIEHFELAYGTEEGCEITANIFAVPEWTSIVQPDDEELAPAKAAPKRSRKRKMRG